VYCYGNTNVLDVMMLRILELAGLLSPVLGAALLIAYRRRSAAAFGWGLTACVLGVLASAIGVLAPRLSALDAALAGAGLEGVLARMDAWAVAQYGLLLVACALLIVAARVDRERGTPLGWMIAGLALVAGGVVASFAHVDLGSEHERLTTIVAILIGTVEVAAMGLGFLALCVAAVAHRAHDDGRQEPAELARRLASTAWRTYTETRAGKR
jgi:hypothetical protein